MTIHSWREASVARFLMPHYWIVILLKFFITYRLSSFYAY